ncbi:winged helix-turn-helix transcriptional regulator [Alicyclobacillus ferrooxydans]|uniref:HxlR family transcriptional regulator n=1 Tax=Alicyclobacillus ferrooxydans TaxID=471514 RepID=A0A0P9D0P9_9BACL|nr:helix-turn-helix domain-containing protein [Alicyclobacillus ferrooxydans]KPV43065.1 HxlR family transcriptional regulator [Alicyclobacillus ferrooxydans]
MDNSVISPRFTSAFDILGKRWTGLIIATLVDGPHHFNEILELIPELNESMLSKRLKEMIGEGIVTRDVYSQTPVCIEYRLTDKGQALHSVLEEVYDWADVWMDDM